MRRYLMKRVLISIPIFLVITLLSFVLSDMAPGGPVEALAASSGTLTVEEIDALKVRLGLDKPMAERYVLWLGDLFQGDLGNSYAYGKPVMYLIGERIGPTLMLSSVSLLLAIIIGVPLGILSACKQYSAADSVTSGYAYLTQSVPGFFVAFLLIFAFAAKLKIFPTSGMYDPNTKSLASLARHMVLPALAGCFGTMGIFIRQTRSAMLEVMNEDYMRTARSKGIRKSQVIVRHAIRNAMMPVVTVVGMCVMFMVSGSLIIENMFAWPGIGSLMMTAIGKRDYPIIMGITVLISISILVINLVMDVVYALLDPRISFGAAAK